MFKENDMVVYGAHGVCKIAEICEKDFNRKKKVYYVLKPVKSDYSTFFVPADNETLITKMRKILSKEEINKLIDSMPNEKANWIFDETERKEKYKNIISQGDHIELIKMIKAIFFEKGKREAVGRHLRASDEHFLKDAEQLLYGEFQYVLNLSEDQLMTYIFDRIENNDK